MPSASFIFGVFWACLLAVLPSASADTILQYTSSPNNYVSRIPGHTLIPNAKTRFQIGSEDRGNTIYLQIIEPSTHANGVETLLYQLKFSAPTSTALRPGTYDFPGVNATAKTPGFEFSGSQGFGGPSSGQFQVTELHHNPDGSVLSFAASFAEADNNNAGTSSGSVEYNSGQPAPPVSVPSVSVVATTAIVGNGTDKPGVFAIQRTGATTAALAVSYTLGGKAVNGVDYLRTVGPVIIQAGKSTAFVKVRPLDTGGSGQASVKLKLSVPPGNSYTVEGSGQAKVMIYR